LICCICISQYTHLLNVGDARCEPLLSLLVFQSESFLRTVCLYQKEERFESKYWWFFNICFLEWFGINVLCYL